MTRRAFLASILAPSGARALSADGPLNWIALNLAGEIRNANWPNAGNPVSVGSLLKPFLALAYLTTHAQSPVVECRGAIAGCWSPQGHGRQDIISALAISCNVYFMQLTANLNRAALDLTCLSYGLSSPPRNWPPSRLIGLDEGWPQSPISIARAFAGLVRNASDPRVHTVLDGMARCARSGTAQAAGLPCFAKTGTARCSHFHRGCGDGYAVAIYPLNQPRYVVLMMRHNTTGAHAAKDLKLLISSSFDGRG